MTLMAVDLDKAGKPKNGWWKTVGAVPVDTEDTLS